jgi:cysteine-rich repeat protein
MDGVFQHGQCVRCQDVPGFTLDKEHGGCEPICGDGMRLGRERCDDGNRKPGDGCNQICQVESGYICLKNEDQLNDTCYLRPKATFEISPADPYNILVKFDHEMQEDHLCSQFSLRSNGADRAALDLNVTVTQVANKECVIHIEYPITLLGDVIYLRINNTNMMVDNNSFPIDPSNNDFIATFEGYIISGEHKHQFAKLTILVSKAFKWLVAIILVWSLPLFRYNSGYLIWNLVDFLQRLCILTMIQTRLPFNLQEFLNSINFIVFDIDHGYELPWLHLKFFSNAWPLLIFIVGVEILNLIFAIMANLCGMHADIRTKFRWTIRLRLYSICTFPVALVVFDCLNPAHIYADILSACLAGGTAFLYILFSLKILRDLSIAFDPFSSKISKQIDLAYKYYEFLNEVNFKNLVARLYPLMVVQTRVFEAVIVCYVGIFSSRMQVVLLMGIESVMLAMNSSLDVLSDKSVKRLTMLQQIVMIAILACIGIIGESKEGVLNIQIAWGIEIAVAVMVLILFAVNMKRLLIRSALNIRLSVDKMINQWKDSFNNTEGQSLKQNEKKPVSDEGKKVQSADQSHFKISEEDEEAQ